MKSPFHLLVFASVGIAAASAQDSEPELDLARIRERAAEHAPDAEALATTVRTRAEALAEDAQASRQQAHANRAAYADTLPSIAVADADTGPLDLDGMIRGAADAEVAAIGESPRFIAFASLGMPEASLKALVRDVTRAGGVTVLRGFPQGDSARFKRRLVAIWSDSGEAGALGIDPRLFRAFDIRQAPSFVMLAADFHPCDGFDCTDAPPPHDRLTGNIRVEEVLDTFASGGGPGANLARLHLQRLRGDRP